MPDIRNLWDRTIVLDPYFSKLPSGEIKTFEDWYSREGWIMIAHPSLKDNEEAKNAPYPNIWISIEDNKIWAGIAYSTIRAVEEKFIGIVFSNLSLRQSILEDLKSFPLPIECVIHRKVRGLNENKQSKTKFDPLHTFSSVSDADLRNIVDLLQQYREEWKNEPVTPERKWAVPAIDLLRCVIPEEVYDQTMLKMLGILKKLFEIDDFNLIFSSICSSIDDMIPKLDLNISNLKISLSKRGKYAEFIIDRILERIDVLDGLFARCE